MKGDGDIIRLDGVGKAYRIPLAGRDRFLGSMETFLAALRGRSGEGSRYFRSFEALRQVDLRIGKGESVAIIGRNGSGKSTLLQVIAGILRASAGEVVVRGKLSALLQLGAGFNADYTGRENLYLSGLMYGLSREEMGARMEQMLAFADIGDFVDQPVRTYSSGMRLRLAFAVITTVDPEILIIDEALSVGDAFFQSRCVRWLEEYVKRGNTFLCVSHDMFMVKRLCKRGIVLDGGNKVFDGEIGEAANVYYRLYRQVSVPRKTVQLGRNGKVEEGWETLKLNTKNRTGDGRALVQSVRTRPDIGQGCLVGDWIEIELEVEAREPIAEVNYGFGFRDRSGQLIGGYHSLYTNEPLKFKAAGECKRVYFEVRLDLKPQVYLIIVGLAINSSYDEWHDLDCLWDCAQIEVTGGEPFWGLTSLPVRNKRVGEAANK